MYRGPLSLGEIDTNERVVGKGRRRRLVVTVEAGSQNGQVWMWGGGGAEGVVRKGGSVWAWQVGLSGRGEGHGLAGSERAPGREKKWDKG